jgi:NAD(P)-dependent dehydrogenase (short-subunit alcohol dehydrogenase family)
MDQRLKGKIAIVTGAAGGIGRASALRFAAEGAIVYVNDIKEDGVAAVVREIEAAGGRAVGHPADVTSPEAVQRMVDRAVAEQGRLDILFNNAGGALPKPTHETSVAEYRHIVALNLDAVFYGIHAALPAMIRQKKGVILATSSGAAKAGVINLMRNVAVEYGHLGIRANAIAPGPMLTAGFQAWMDTLPGGGASFARQVPSGRLGTPEDIAVAAAFLAADEAFFVNGALLPVDGAISARLASPREDMVFTER